MNYTNENIMKILMKKEEKQMKFKLILKSIIVTVAGCMLLTKSAFAAGEATLIEPDIISLRDAFDANLGGNTLAGASLTGDEINDPNIMGLVTKHFNAVTLGNELKPDAIFGYNNKKAPELISYDFNGEEYIAPKMDFSRAERMLDYFAKWNAENPDRQIKVRGHVLVWHSQTPEWFFHENYDKKEPYLSPAEMDKRQEWYIREVLTHFTTKYEGLFYGWDVVNEAISDATGDYRTDVENSGDKLSDDTHGSKSSWWKVYQSNKYIINAFRFANKYAPDYVELYYNDYNECTPLKSNGIIKLIEEVKAADGTRLDGFGMQGHYDMQNPTGGQVKVAARRYAEVAGSVSITELDLKASSSYDGSDEEKEKEFRRQYYKYKEIYQGLSELVDEGVNVRTVTVWGVIDRNSWLQSQNNVGGASNGKQRQCPLLFDDNYKAKPLFYALCNEDMPAVIVPSADAVEEEASEETVVEEDTKAEDIESVDNTEADDSSNNETEKVAANDTKQTDATEENAIGSDNKEAEEDSNRSSIIGIICIFLGAFGVFGVVLGKKRKKELEDKQHDNKQE